MTRGVRSTWSPKTVSMMLVESGEDVMMDEFYEHFHFIEVL